MLRDVAATLYDIGKAASLRPKAGSGFGLNWSQVVPPTVQQLPVPATAKVFYELTPVRVIVSFGKTISQPPQPTAIMQKMFAAKTATRVYYMEIWEHDVLIAGTGYIDFYYIGVYS